MSRARLLTIAAAASLLVATAGFAWDAARFGWGDDAAYGHLREEITRRVAERARLVETTASRVARLSNLVAAATASRDRLPELFARINDPLAAGPTPVSATVWIDTPAPVFRALAWTDGPAEDIPAAYLAQAPGLFVASGSSGLRLISLQPITLDGRSLGVAAAETSLSIPSAAGALEQHFRMATSIGPVEITAVSTAASTSGPNRFLVGAPAGPPLIQVTVDPDQASGARRNFRWRIVAAALLPWSLPLLPLLGQFGDRRRAAGSRGVWLAWTSVLMTLIGGYALALTWIVGAAHLPDVTVDAIWAIAALSLAAVGPGSAWQRTRPRRPRSSVAVRFAAEHLLAGAVLAAGFVATVWLWRSRISPTSIEQWHLPILPSSVPTAIGLSSLLLAQIAMSWPVAAALGVVAARWRLSWRRAATWVAALLWLAPGICVLWWTEAVQDWPLAGALVLAAGAVAFGVTANAIRRQYRHTSEARRLLMQFGALMVPILIVYPLASASADRATRELIAADYAPATMAAQQPDILMAVLTSAWAGIDAIADLPEQLQRANGSANTTQLAFRVWNRTVLARDRVTSQIELYGPARTLVSRFSLNVPEFGSLTQSGEAQWPGAGCDWDAFAEVARFGAGERRMLHAERALCGPNGEFLGAVVIRIIPDYRTLPFVASTNPYYDALGGGDFQQTGGRISQLEVVVYGWGLLPVFVSGRVIWPIDEPLADRLYQSRDPFWLERQVDDRTYHVYLLNDRGGIYALGYPAPTPLQDATRLAESAALLMLLFGTYLIVTVAAAPAARRRVAPLGRLFTEIRASFHRKLFLFFVVAAVGPVVLFAVVFGSYMTGRLRSDVESEAESVVLMARRVLDELGAAQTPAGQTRTAPDDDAMVWIRQVVDQDVNLFEGAELRATSQRDLFDSGLLPTRTLASAYRQVALERRPVAVIEDRIGAFRYLVAAAPVPALGRETVLTVPLASRQREFERQIDELTQGVLTGAVVLVLFAAALGASVAGRVSDPVARLTRATQLVAAGRFDERLATETADELGRLVRDFNTMTDMLAAQRAELARANQVKAWAEMARQVAHEIKNPLTPIQLAAEHLQRVNDDAGRPLGPVAGQCLTTILKQVRLLRQIAGEFSTFASAPTPRFERVDVPALVSGVVEPYRSGRPPRIEIETAVPDGLPSIRSDQTLLSRALTNLIENALQAMPDGGRLRIAAAPRHSAIEITVEDTGVGMDEEGVRRAFEPYFSTKTGGSGLGLANARRNVEVCGGTLELESRRGSGTTVTMRLPVVPPAARARA